METEPPPKNWFLLQLLIVFLTALLIGFFIGLELGTLMEIIDELPIPKIPDKELLLIQGNTFKGVSSVITPKPSLGMIIEAQGKEVVRRECGGNSKVCNKEFGSCRFGMGRWGFIQSTWNSTLDKMLCRNKFNIKGCIKAYLPERCDQRVSYKEQDLIPEEERTHPVFDEEGECSDLTGLWLLENEGIGHWESEDGSWGSGPYNFSEY